jgi:hypothetical protein
MDWCIESSFAWDWCVNLPYRKDDSIVYSSKNCPDYCSKSFLGDDLQQSCSSLLFCAQILLNARIFSKERSDREILSFDTLLKTARSLAALDRAQASDSALATKARGEPV